MRSNLLIGVLVGAIAALVSTSLTFDAYFAVADGWLLASPTPARTIEARVASLEAWRKGVVTKGLVTPMITLPYKKPSWTAASIDFGHFHGVSSLGTDIPCYCAYPPTSAKGKGIALGAADFRSWGGNMAVSTLTSHYHLDYLGNKVTCTCFNPLGLTYTAPVAPPIGYHYHYSYLTGARICAAPCNCAYPPTHMHTARNGVLAPCNCTEALK